MKNGLRTLLLVCCLGPSLVFGADYKDWLPMFPKSLGGIAMSGKDDGVNSTMSPMNTTVLSRTYGKKPGHVRLIAIWEPAGTQINLARAVLPMNINTNGTVMHAIKHQGYDGRYLYQPDKGVMIEVILSNTAMVRLEAPKGKNDEAKYTGMLKALDLKKLATKM
jgi:hypothetical protein